MNLEAVNKYLQGRMGVKEAHHFEEMMEQNLELAKEVEYQKNVKDAFIIESRDAYKDKFATWEKENKTNSIPLSSNNGGSTFKKWLIAASVILIGVVGWFTLNKTQSSSEKLYSSYFSAYPNTEYNITRSSDTGTLTFQAFSEYEAKNYEQALIKLKDAKNESDTSLHFLFYMAQCHQQLNELSKAKAIYLDLIDQNDSNFTLASKWYLALIYLREKEKETAQNLLTEIRDTNGFKANEAAQILKTIH